jgi:hypothetical protein
MELVGDNLIELSQQKGVKLKTKERKLRNCVYWQGT